MAYRYVWEIEFDSGQVISQNNRPTGFDPQDPLESYGRAMRIRLVPVTGGSPIEVPIPAGYKPVCHRSMIDCGNGPNIASYRIGYRNDRVRFITSVDSNGIVTEIVDKCQP